MKTRRSTVRSWRRLLFIALPPLAAALFALTLALPALADTVVNITSPISFTRTNPCNGENVTFSGNGHLNFHLTFDSGGGVHYDLHTNSQDVKGIGDQGNTYTIPLESLDSVNGQVGREATVTLTEEVISQGSAPNFVLDEDAHTTVNADGTITVSFDNVTTACQG